MEKKKNLYPVLANGGQLIFYYEDKTGIKRESIHYLRNKTFLNINDKIKKYENFKISDDKLDYQKEHYVLKYPLKVGTKWTVKDLTRVKYREGFDKIFQTRLPLTINHEIVGVSETLIISGKRYNNCIKVIGKGETSYNVGPPLGNILIQVETTNWYAPGFGLLKTIRKEGSDLSVVGRIKTTRIFEEVIY